jgi:hypothetical protein
MDKMGVVYTLHQLSPMAVLSALLASALSVFRGQAALHLEILALRHQLGVLQRSVKKPKLTPADRLLWGVAVRILARLAVCPHHREAGDRDRLAPEGLSTFLDLESPSRPNRTAKRFERSP